VLQLRKGDIQDLLDLDLPRCHLVNQALALTRKIPKIRNQRRGRPLNQGIPIGKKKLGNDNGILLVRLGLPELHLYVIGNQQRVDQKDLVTRRNKVREEIDMIGRRRFHPDQNGGDGKRHKMSLQFFKTLSIHGR
jgi:hypothetical protein